MKRFWQAGLLGLGLLLAACGTTTQQSLSNSDVLIDESQMGVEDQMLMDDLEVLTGNGNARVRVVHLAPDAPAVDILVDNTVASRSLEYTNFIGPVALPAGKRNLKVNAAGTSTTVIDVTPTLEAGKRYTALAVGKLAGIEPLLLSDTTFAFKSAGMLRLLHGAPSAPAVDIYISRPGKDLNQLQPTLKNIRFKTASPYLIVRPGEVQVRITPAGTKTVVIDSGTLSIKATDVFTAIAIDRKGASGFSAIVINEREVKAPNPPAPPAPRSIVEIASGNPAFSTLVGALQAADLVGALSGAGPFTVFAPTNDAFAKLSSVPSGDALKNVLLYHVASGRFDAASLLRSGEVTTLQGQKMRVRRMGNAVILNDNVMVTTADIPASNGIIHVIDTVLIPPLPSILEIAAATPALSTLVSAVQSAGLVGALSGNGPFTVFAPTNDAFGRLSSVPSGDALRSVLTYHVASGRFTAAQLTELARRHSVVRTLQGANIQLSLDGNGNLLLNGNVRVVTANVNASNGIVHVIDRVLIPPSH